MNVFRSRKKSISEAEAPRPSLENAPPLPRSNRTIFGRKKVAPEPKKEEIDLNAVLPSDNEFRTSLLMPNLAQRFSMLREQDDPGTKIGKASDDSVLFPKRASRLDLFGLGNLDDIAEVSSVAGSFRPPFARDGRTDSYASDGFDGYASDTGSANGSVMSRSRPGQGNKLFGGRQKVYKISNRGSAAKDANVPESPVAITGRSMGKAVYEDDISSSLWQRLRAEERTKRSFDFDPSEVGADGRMSPPFNNYNRNRETSSSMNSNERMSTAATSMTSFHDGSTTSLPAMMTKEPARDRPLNKRMYGQGIDQQVHEQQNSAMQRLNSVRGGRAFGSLTTPKGSQRAGAASAASSLRSGSPSPALNPASGFDFGLDRVAPQTPRDGDSGYHGPSAVPSPISPHPADPTLAAHMDPNDLGKATASGAFNKPKASYDDQQFAQRQMQLRDNRERSLDSQSRSETPQGSTPGRTRKESDTSAGRGASAASYMRKQNHRGASRDSNGRQASGQSRAGSHGIEASDSEDSAGRLTDYRHRESNGSSVQGGSYSYETNRSSNTSRQAALDEQHPAFRAPIDEEAELSFDKPGHMRVPSLKLDSLNLDNMPGALSDMVKGHLRNRSDASSVYSDTVASHSSHHGYENTYSERLGPTSAPLTGRHQLETLHRARANSAARGGLAGLQYRDDSAGHTRSPSNDTLLERDAFADELADRRRQVEEKLRNIAESRANFDAQADPTSKGFGLLKSNSKTSLVNENNHAKGLKKFMSASGAATPTGDDENRSGSPPRRPQTSRKTSDVSQQDYATSQGRSSPRSPMRERDIGAERRARHAAAKAIRSPTGTGPPAPRGQVEARKQQFAGATGSLPRDFTERVVANPDQGKPHFHPAGRARHYSPPRASTTPDQKPQLPLQTSQNQTGPVSRSVSRSRERHAGMASSGRARSNTKEHSNDSMNGRFTDGTDVSSPQMVTPGTYPPPANTPMQYAAARKRSVSKADISMPVNLVSSTYALSTVDLSPGASLENGMDEIRAADAIANPPPVPPINPRRRAMGGFKKLSRSNTGSPDSEEDGSLSPRPTLRKQMSEGSSLRGRIRDRVAMPASPSKNY